MAKTVEDLQTELDSIEVPEIKFGEGLFNITNASEVGAANKQKKSLQQSIEASKTAQNDLEIGQGMVDTILGEDFALERLGDRQDVQDVTSQLQSQAVVSDAERIAQRESAMNSLQSSQETQNRDMLRSLSSSGVRGGAAAGALTSLSMQQSQAKDQINQNLWVQQQQMERQGTQALAQWTSNIAQFDIGQAAAEQSAKIQAGLQGASLISNERSAIRSHEAAMVAARNAGKGGKK